MGRKAIGPEVRKEAVAMAQADPPMEVKTIAEELGVSVPTVYRFLGEAGIRPKRKVATQSWRKLDEEQVAEFIQKYLDYEPVLKLLVEFSINHSQMYQMLLEHEVEPRMRQRGHAKASDVALKHALDLYQNSDYTIAEITGETGVHQPVLHAAVRRENIPLRRPRQVRNVQTESDAVTLEVEAEN